MFNLKIHFLLKKQNSFCCIFIAIIHGALCQPDFVVHMASAHMIHIPHPQISCEVVVIFCPIWNFLLFEKFSLFYPTMIEHVASEITFILFICFNSL